MFSSSIIALERGQEVVDPYLHLGPGRGDRLVEAKAFWLFVIRSCRVDSSLGQKCNYKIANARRCFASFSCRQEMTSLGVFCIGYKIVYPMDRVQKNERCLLHGRKRR